VKSIKIEKFEIKIGKKKERGEIFTNKKENEKENKVLSMNEVIKSNIPRWDGRKKGHYEVWYVTGNSGDYGFWIRYTLNVAEEGHNSWSGVWCAIFKKGEKPLGICRKFPLSDFHFENKNFLIKIGDTNELGERKLKGKINVKNISAEWEIEFEPTGYVYKHLPEAAYYLPLETEVLSPNPDLKLKGYIKIKDLQSQSQIQDIKVDGRGYQAHVWGKKHAFRWVWGHCNSILDENGNLLEDSFFEGVTVVAKRGPIHLPPITLFSLRYKGENFEFNNFRDILFNSAKWEYGDNITWEIRSRKMNFSLKMKGDKNNFIMATYDDPDGEKAFCHNSEIESAEIEFEMKGKKFKLFCPGTFHTEFGARAPLEYDPQKFLYE
jgi:hypothetical protein